MRRASIRTGLRSPGRRPGHGLAAGGTLAAAVAVSLPASLLVRVESWLPLRLAPGVRASSTGRAASIQLPGRRFHEPWLRVTAVVEDLRAPGLGTAVAAAWLPIRRAARRSPRTMLANG